jgi:hypothetical protein
MVVVGAEAPQPLVVRTLVKTVMYASIYAFAFFNATNEWYKRAQSALVAPLRKVLALPMHTSHENVLVEFGLPTLVNYREECTVREAQRIIGNVSTNAATKRWEEVERELVKFERTSNKNRRTAMTMNEEAAVIAKKMEVKSVADVDKEKMRERAHGKWKEEAKPEWLREWRPKYGCASYLKYDDRLTATNRARLRLQQAQTADAQQYKHTEESLRKCSHCDDVGTAQHIINECKEMEDDRAQLTCRVFMKTGRSMSIWDLACGAVDDGQWTNEEQRWLLRESSVFLNTAAQAYGF